MNAKPAASKEEKSYTIGEVAERLAVSVEAIRLYDREGLILPYRRNSKHRRYVESDIERIRCIRKMINKEKIGIAGIKRILSFIPCWKIKNCPLDARASCRAFGEHDGPCWTVRVKPWDCKHADCRACPVYANAPDCRTLKRAISLFTVDRE